MSNVIKISETETEEFSIVSKNMMALSKKEQRELTQKYIQRGRELVQDIKQAQLEISRMAVELCVIGHGGISNNIYTLTDYANDIGMNKSTLANWVSIYRDVILKLPEIKQLNVDFRIARKVHSRLKQEQTAVNKDKDLTGKLSGYKKNMPKERVTSLYEQIEDESPVVGEVQRCLASAKHIKSIITKRDLRLADQRFLTQLMENLDVSSDTINDYLTNGYNK